MVMLLNFTNSLSLHSLLQGMLWAQGDSHRQAHLWQPPTEGQHQFSHLVSLPATKNSCNDTNMTFSNTAKHSDLTLGSYYSCPTPQPLSSFISLFLYQPTQSFRPSEYCHVVVLFCIICKKNKAQLFFFQH